MICGSGEPQKELTLGSKVCNESSAYFVEEIRFIRYGLAI